MKSHRFTFVLSALILALLTWYFWPTPTPSPAQIPASTASLSPLARAQSQVLASAPPSERSTLADTLNSPTTTIRAR